MALLQRTFSLASTPLATRRASGLRSSVVARAEGDGPRVVQGREFREADSTVSMPGSSPAGSQGGPLYADEVQRTQVKPKSNLSPEMKKRLRQEYTGWGGAENKPMQNNYFLWVIAFVALLAVASHQIGAI